MKRVLLLFLLICCCGFLKAQDIPDIPQLTKTWTLIAGKTYKENLKGKLLPVFPANLKALENKIVELPGFMIPVKTGLLHTMFFISVLPIYQCSFCGQFGIPSMVEVHTLKGVPFSDTPITIRGKLTLNSSENYELSEIFLLDAEVVK